MESRRDRDQQLVDAAKGGDLRAFELLMSDYRGVLIGVVNRMVKNREDAEDLVQDSMIKAFTDLPRFRGDSAFFSWMYSITRNTALNFLKTTRVKTNKNLSEDIHDLTDSGFESVLSKAQDATTPEQIYCANQLAEVLIDAVNSLSKEYRDTWILYDLECLTYEEIAERLDLPMGTIKSRVCRARDRLAEVLRPVLDNPPRDRRW